MQLVVCLCDQVSAKLGYPPISQDQYYHYMIDQTITSLHALEQQTNMLTVKDTEWQPAPTYTTDQSLNGARPSEMFANAGFTCAMPSAISLITSPDHSNRSLAGLTLDPSLYQ